MSLVAYRNSLRERIAEAENRLSTLVTDRFQVICIPQGNIALTTRGAFWTNVLTDLWICNGPLELNRQKLASIQTIYPAATLMPYQTYLQNCIRNFNHLLENSK